MDNHETFLETHRKFQEDISTRLRVIRVLPGHKSKILEKRGYFDAFFSFYSPQRGNMKKVFKLKSVGNQICHR